MASMVWSQLRFRAGRTLALFAALVIAVTSFAVLSGTARTQRLQVTGTVTANYRGAYDILVRPNGTQNVLEKQRGLISSTAMTSINGGISTAQWQKILHTPGVGVAAPVAVVGYSYQSAAVATDISAGVPGDATRSLFRVQNYGISENGLTKIRGYMSYQYVTRQPLHSGGGGGTAAVEYGDGTAHTICDQAVIACSSLNADDSVDAPSPANPHATGTTREAGAYTYILGIPMLIEAIDPVQEAKLDGLDAAVTSGRYFAPDQGSVHKTGTISEYLEGDWGNDPADWYTMPVLVANRTFMDETMVAQVSRLPQSAADQVYTGKYSSTQTDAMDAATGTPTQTITITAQHAYDAMLQQMVTVSDTHRVANSQLSGTNLLNPFITAGPIQYAVNGSTLTPVTGPSMMKQINPTYGIDDPVHDGADESFDTGVRSLREHAPPLGSDNQNGLEMTVVGQFDPDKLNALTQSLAAVPMETYFPASATGADPASRAALQNKPLLPNGNEAGLLSVPPSLITTLATLPQIYTSKHYQKIYPEDGVDAAAPISVVRVRLAGDIGMDALSREKVRAIAQQIQQETGLTVDIALGSSPGPVSVIDPAGRYGRPQLTLSELWSHKGVAAVIVAAIDRKSLILFVLVLVVCALFVAGATAAAVRSRRTELAVLACLGWPARRLFRLILGETAVLALGAGVVGALVATPIGAVLGIHVDLAQAALAIPAALVLALLAAISPARRAARSDPGVAVRPSVASVRRAARVRGIVSLGLNNLRRVPGRSLLASVALAVGVAALVALAGLQAAFGGQVTGTLLGSAVTVQVRGTDYAAAAIAALMGVACVADVLYVNIRDRAAEYAVLHATGWRDSVIGRLILTESLVLAVIGVVLGSLVAIGADAWLTHRFTASLAVIGAAVGVAAIAVTLGAALVPAAALRRVQAARYLAEE